MKMLPILRLHRDAWMKTSLCVIFSGIIMILGFSTSAAETISSGSDIQSVPPKTQDLVFGVYTHVRSTVIFKKMDPLRKYLEAALKEKGISVDIAIKIFPTYDAAIHALVSGEIDFSRFGAVSYVRAKALNPNIQLVVMESNHGKKQFNGVISVRQDSAVHSIGQLKGMSVAFGNQSSTAGRYLAQAALVKAGIKKKDLEKHIYLGRHDKVIFAVAMGKYDAGASNENTYNKYAKQKELRKIAVFSAVTKPWVSREGLDQSTFAALQSVLLELKDNEALKPIKRSGFLPTTDADYDSIREAIKLAEEFGDDS
jgi:phosphonate transport system substrate-binding protein